MKVATGLARGIVAHPDLAGAAVTAALDRAGLRIAESVLLFLSADFAHDPQPALHAAARAGNCLQVSGCTAAGVFTEEEWILDVPAAAAMVFGDGLGLRHALDDDLCCLTLAAPNAIDPESLAETPARCFGGLAGDTGGSGPYAVWQGGRLAPERQCRLVVDPGRMRIDVSRGVQPLSEPREITRVAGHDVLAVDGQPALASLAQRLPLPGDSRRFPMHLVMAGVTYGDPDNALSEGRYHLLPILSTNLEESSVTVSTRLRARERLFWAIRQPLAAERDLRLMLDRITADALREPTFGLCFPCMGRGPHFFGGIDRDLEQITRRFPGMPLAGFYGNGEIAHAEDANRLLQYATVLALHDV